MRLTNQLKLSVILIALYFSGCAGLQPRLDLNEPSGARGAAQRESRDARTDTHPVELYGAAERGSFRVGGKVTVLTW